MSKTLTRIGDGSPSKITAEITSQGALNVQNFIASGDCLSEVDWLTLKIKGKFDEASVIVENIRQRKYRAISENDHDEEIMARQDEEFYKGRRQAFSNVLAEILGEVSYK